MSSSRAPISSPRHIKTNALQRGKACLTCRRRKMRCDGSRPVCSQCRNGRRESECEYDECKSKSRTQMLMENVSRLEQRLQDLKKDSGPSSKASSQCSGSSDELSPMTHDIHPYYLDGLLHGPGVDHADIALIENMLLPDADLWSPSSLLDNPDSWLPDLTLITDLDPISLYPSFDTGPPPSLQCTFVTTFIAHQHLFGFQLPHELSSNPSCSTSLLKPPLFNAVLLWGCRLQASDTCSGFEPELLNKSLESISEALADSDLLIDVLQATVLVANYFYSSGRLLEGKYHADAAAALVVALDMHRIPESFGQINSHVRPRSLDVFWNVFELGCWTVATGAHPPLLVSQDPRALVQAPWPGGNNSTIDQEFSVLDRLLRCGEPMSQGEYPLSLRAKSAALLQLASRLSSSLSEDQGSSSSPWENLRQLETCITMCSASLGPLPEHDPSTGMPPPPEFFHVIFVHSFLSVAMILLHYPLAKRSPTSLDKCQTWARKVLYTVEKVPPECYRSLHPMLSMCWAVAGDILLEEIIACIGELAPQPRVLALQGELDSILNSMSLLSKTSPISDVLLKRIETRYVELKR